MTKASSVFLGTILLFSASLLPLQAAPVKGSATGEPGLFPSLKDPAANLYFTHTYWHDGLHIDGRYKNLKFRIGGTIMVDGGNLHAGKDIKKNLPNFENKNSTLRKLELELNGVFFDAIETKFQIDFANVREIKDNWLRFLNVPVLKRFKFGNMKEPFSLEALISSRDIPFMERSLPVMAFSPGRNIGIQYNSLPYEEKMTVAVGAFLNTASFSNIGTATDQIEQKNGWDLTGRVTYLFKREEKEFLHLGFSYSHQFLGRGSSADDIKLSALPESYLTNTRLVDTGGFRADGADIFDAEVAYVSGPFSVQGELFNAFVNAGGKGNPHFRGSYVSGSYFLTGETRPYDKTRGVFSKVRPLHPFHLMEGQWGAWEATLRGAYIDLDSAGIRGGRERNLSAGLNWYLYPRARVMLNYIHVELLKSDTPGIRNGRADILMVRLQFGF